MFISLCNTKGGVGKSTLASHLAIWLYDHGSRVALLDTDVQQTSARWIRTAEPGIKVAVATEMAEIQKARAELIAAHDFVVVDTPGRESDVARTAALLADLAIIPLQPSKPDVRALHEALKSIRLAQEISGGARPQVAIVLNQTAKGDLQTRLLRQELAAEGFPLARSEVRRLNAVRDACDSSVTRRKPSEAREASADIEALFTELFGDAIARLNANRRITDTEKEEVANG